MDAYGAASAEQNKAKCAQGFNKAGTLSKYPESGKLENNPKGFAVHLESITNSLGLIAD